MKTVKKAAKVKKEQFTFEVTTDWKPSKVGSSDPYLQAIVSTACKLIAGESFGIPMIELTTRFGYKTGESAASSLRSHLGKIVGKKLIGSYSTHVVKDHSGKAVSIRIRKK